MVVELVFAVEMEGKRIMLCELVETVHHRVPGSEQAVHPVRLHGGETLLADGPVTLQQRLRDHERGLSVLPLVVELLLSQPIVFQDGIGQVKGRVDTDPVETGELLGEHPAHGRSHDKVRLLVGTEVFQQLNGLPRIHRKVRCNHRRLRKQQTHPSHRSARPGGGEAMDIEDFLAGEKPRPGIFIEFHTAKVGIIS